MFDNSARTNAIQAIGLGLGKGPSSGLVAFYGGKGLKVAAGVRALGFNSTYGNGGLDTHGTWGSLYRLTYDTPAIAGWNVSVGTFGIGGTTTGTTSALFENMPQAPGINPVTGALAPWFGNINNHEITSNGFDIQAQGQIAGMDTQVLLSMVNNYEFQIRNRTDTMTMVNMDLASNSLEVQVMPNAAWGVRLGMMNYSDNNFSAKDYTTTSIGVNYNYADNVRFSIENSSIDLDTGTDYSETLLQALLAF